MKKLAIDGKVLNKKLNDAYREISENVILMIAKKNPVVNNIVTGLCKEGFAVWSYEEGFSKNYTLVYINGQEKLLGEAIDLNLEDNDRYDITMAFCNHLTREYEHLDLIDTFNTYSHKLRSYIEMFDCVTVSDDDFRHEEGSSVTIIAKTKALIYVPQINKLALYRDFFDNSFSQSKPAGENVVYLLLDMETGHIKIGRSISITHREKTLQSQAPKIETIAFWRAPKEAETQLHKTFISKRVRGEWFKLTFMDMKEIKNLMKGY